MHTTRTPIRAPLLALLAGLALTGCFNGDSDGVAPPVAQEPATVPETALSSPQALVDWAGAQPASETQEPLDVSMAQLPVSDDGEPAPLR